VPHWVTEWAEHDGLGSKNVGSSLYGGRLIEYEFGNGGEERVVTHYETIGGCHCWPSTLPNVDDADGTFYNATRIIMV